MRRAGAATPPTVLFLIDELDDWRGTEAHLFQLTQGLDKSRLRPVVAVVGLAGLEPEFRAAGIPFYRLQVRRALGLSGLRGVARFASICRREAARLIVSYHTASDLLAPLAGVVARVPTVSCRRDDGFSKKPIHKRLQRRLNGLVGGMISVSDAVRQAVARDERFDPRRNLVIWNGVDAERFRPGPSAARQALGIAPEALVVACVGGLDPVKNHAALIEAFARVLARRPDGALLLVGDGLIRKDLERQAAPLGDRVRFLGHRADVPDLLRAADIYVQASQTEGFSNAVLQAMATALPVLVTAVGGNVELVTVQTGRLVPPGDVEAIARGLAALMDDPALRRRLGEAARRRAAEQGSQQAMIEAYCQAFERVIAGDRLTGG
jgi:glycosyltransferase involved in cell wall biosynthesis